MTLVLIVGAFAAPAVADEHDHNNDNDDAPELPRHTHMLLVGVEIDMDVGPAGAIVDYVHCFEMADFSVLPNRVHHDTVHLGPEAEDVQAAGHWVIPGAPLGEYDGCDDVEAPVNFPPPPEE